MTSFTEHLIELRRRLIYGFSAVGLLWFALLPFSNSLYHLLAIPLIKQLPHHSNFIAINIASTFFVPMKFAGITALVLCVPFLLYQIWAFIMPALYRSEKKWLWPFMLSGILLFYSGVLFAYFVVFPLLFQFFVQTAPPSVTLLPDISAYLNLAMQLLLVFGLAFEVPVIVVILIVTGLTDIKNLAAKRRYFIVAAFIMAMFLTPPDVVSQISLAVPLCLLFEAGLLAARLIMPLSPVAKYN